MAESGSIDTLKTLISSREGLAKPSHFVVEFSLPAGVGSSTQARDMAIMCLSATIPTRSITSTDYTSFRQPFKIPNGFTNDDVTCEFLLSNDFFPKTVFDAWLSLSVDPVSYRARYVKDYAVDISIYQLDEYMNRIYGVTLQDAFPITISAIDVNSSNTDEVQKMSVTFSYNDSVLIKGIGAPKKGPDNRTDKGS